MSSTASREWMITGISSFPSQLKLGLKGGDLPLAGDVLIVVIQANFPNGLDLFLPGEFPQEGKALRGNFIRRIGVAPYCRIEERVFLSQGDARPASF